MPDVISAEKLAAQVCNSLGIPPRDHAEALAETLRTALANTKAAAVTATKTVCLEIAEDEAERCRSAGATTAQQTALTIAARVRRRQV